MNIENNLKIKISNEWIDAYEYQKKLFHLGRILKMN